MRSSLAGQCVADNVVEKVAQAGEPRQRRAAQELVEGRFNGDHQRRCSAIGCETANTNGRAQGLDTAIESDAGIGRNNRNAGAPSTPAQVAKPSGWPGRTRDL